MESDPYFNQPISIHWSNTQPFTGGYCRKLVPYYGTLSPQIWPPEVMFYMIYYERLSIKLQVAAR